MMFYVLDTLLHGGQPSPEVIPIVGFDWDIPRVRVTCKK